MWSLALSNQAVYASTERDRRILNSLVSEVYGLRIDLQAERSKTEELTSKVYELQRAITAKGKPSHDSFTFSDEQMIAITDQLKQSFQLDLRVLSQGLANQKQKSFQLSKVVQYCKGVLQSHDKRVNDLELEVNRLNVSQVKLIVDVNALKSDSVGRVNQPLHKKNCPRDFEKIANGCYYIQTTPVRLSVANAKSQCSQRNGSQLVSFETLEEFELISKYLADIHGRTSGINPNGWVVGGEQVNGKYVWLTGSAVQTAMWGEGEPDSSAQKCVAIRPDMNFKCANVFCGSYTQQFVCEL